VVAQFYRQATQRNVAHQCSGNPQAIKETIYIN